MLSDSPCTLLCRWMPAWAWPLASLNLMQIKRCGMARFYDGITPGCRVGTGAPIDLLDQCKGEDMDTAIAKREDLERLHGIRFEEDKLTLWVRSNGCTRKEDFQLSITKGGRGQFGPMLVVVRLQPDFCKRAPYVIDITFTWEELGLDVNAIERDTLHVANPFGVSPFPY